MRVYETNNKNMYTLSFVKDIPDGVVCECPFCKKEIDIITGVDNCPVCNQNLVFPTWCDW